MDWRYISYEDNSDVVEAVEGRLGLLDLLDDQCRLPQVSVCEGGWGTTECGRPCVCGGGA